jgi:hypothetical protein
MGTPPPRRINPPPPGDPESEFYLVPGSAGESVTVKKQRGGVFPIECEYCGRPYPSSGDSCLGCGAGLRRLFRATDPGRPDPQPEPIEIEIDLSDGIDLEKFEELFKEALK